MKKSSIFLKFFIFSLFFLQSCAAIKPIVDAVNPLKDGGGVETNVQLGKTNKQEKQKGIVNTKTKKTNNNDIKADKVNQVNNEMPFYMVVFYGVAMLAAGAGALAYFRNIKLRHLNDMMQRKLVSMAKK